ncbi:MAG: hypothetical protein SO100_01320 [Dysosmobacter sp.]|nr:hypothetical protein [Dysosmobacter sp.]
MTASPAGEGQRSRGERRPLRQSPSPAASSSASSAARYRRRWDRVRRRTSRRE